MRIENFKLCGELEEPKAAPASGSAREEDFDLAVLAGTTGSSWDAPVGHVIVDYGANATVAGEDWVASFIGAVTAEERASIHRIPASAVLMFGARGQVAVHEELVIPLLMGPQRVFFRALVLPGGLPLLLSSALLTSLGAVSCITLSTPSQQTSFSSLWCCPPLVIIHSMRWTPGAFAISRALAWWR